MGGKIAAAARTDNPQLAPAPSNRTGAAYSFSYLSMIFSDPKGREAQTGSHPRIKSGGKLFGIML